MALVGVEKVKKHVAKGKEKQETASQTEDYQVTVNLEGLVFEANLKSLDIEVHGLDNKFSVDNATYRITMTLDVIASTDEMILLSRKLEEDE